MKELIKILSTILLIIVTAFATTLVGVGISFLFRFDIVNILGGMIAMMMGMAINLLAIVTYIDYGVLDEKQI